MVARQRGAACTSLAHAGDSVTSSTRGESERGPRARHQRNSGLGSGSRDGGHAAAVRGTPERRGGPAQARDRRGHQRAAWQR
eukprot:1227919-Prymnesium_polylepis.1